MNFAAIPGRDGAGTYFTFLIHKDISKYNVTMEAMEVIDFADRSCAGDLINLIEKAILLAQPGQTIKIIARDALLAIDIGAWCSKSGNKLADSSIPTEGIYYIQRA